MSNVSHLHRTVAGLDSDDAATTIELLDTRLAALIDLQLTLKHIHWNVVGPNFLAVHEMLDPHVDAVREMSDQLAERIATLGGSPTGTPGFITEIRTWDDYSLQRASTGEHLDALDAVYSGVIGDHRATLERVAELDPVTEDLLIEHLRQLELFQWFVRAHLQNDDERVARGDRVTA